MRIGEIVEFASIQRKILDALRSDNFTQTGVFGLQAGRGRKHDFDMILTTGRPISSAKLTIYGWPLVHFEGDAGASDGLEARALHLQGWDVNSTEKAAA